MIEYISYILQTCGLYTYTPVIKFSNTFINLYLVVVIVKLC